MDGCGICDPNMLPNGCCHLLAGIYCTSIQTDHYDKRRAIAGTSRMEDRLRVQSIPWLKANSCLLIWEKLYGGIKWSLSSELPLFDLKDLTWFRRLHGFFNLPPWSTCWSSPCEIVSIGPNQDLCSRVRTTDPSMQKPVGVALTTIAICWKTITIHVLKDVSCKSGLA